MWFKAATLALVCVTGSVSAAHADGKGVVVFGFGADHLLEYTNYTLLLRSTDHVHLRTVTYRRSASAARGNTRDDYYDTDESGNVQSLTLAAGSWEIYNFQFGRADGEYAVAKTDFSLPFTVTPGQTAYIGDYRAGTIPQREITPGSAGRLGFYVTDMNARDTTIARERDQSLGAIAIEIPDVSAAHCPFFSTAAESPNTSP